MDTSNLSGFILDVIRSSGPISSNNIVLLAEKKGLVLTSEQVNQMLYGEYREVVVRDRDKNGYPVWRLKQSSFEAAKGYESTLAQELVKKKLINERALFLDYTIEHPRVKKVYHLDIALLLSDKKINIEVDGFDHMRADARYSIQEQIKKKGSNTEIDIDWMDHEKSFVDFSLIDETLVNKWCLSHLKWCIHFHEELLWPNDISRNMWLIENGWTVMRFWNMEVKNSLKDCVEQIKEVVER